MEEEEEVILILKPAAMLKHEITHTHYVCTSVIINRTQNDGNLLLFNEVTITQENAVFLYVCNNVRYQTFFSGIVNKIIKPYKRLQTGGHVKNGLLL